MSKNLPTGRDLLQAIFSFAWGSVAAAANGTARWFARTNTLAAVTSSAPGEFVVPVTGTFLFTLLWHVSGTQMATDTITLEIYKSGAGTGIASVVPISPGATSGSASGSFAVTAGTDTISVRALQSGIETQAALNISVVVRASLP